jgi:catechol 2,3-dioxygenase-like lactoylglutathione lyase family enzyme
MGIGSIRNLDYVVLLCEDLARARQFYLDVMQFRIERETPRWVSLHVGSGLLCLRPRTLDGVFQDGPGAPSGSASVQLAFRVAPPEIDEIQAELAAAGVDLMGPPRDIPAWGHRAIFFRDPDGNVIEIYAEV